MYLGQHEELMKGACWRRGAGTSPTEPLSEPRVKFDRPQRLSVGLWGLWHPSHWASLERAGLLNAFKELGLISSQARRAFALAVGNEMQRLNLYLF